MSDAQHILEQVIAFAQAAGRDDFELFTGESGQPVRQRNRAARLWIMRADENGSMYDRWSSDEGAQLVKLEKPETEQGPAAGFTHLCALADRNISNREERT